MPLFLSPPSHYNLKPPNPNLSLSTPSMATTPNISLSSSSSKPPFLPRRHHHHLSLPSRPCPSLSSDFSGRRSTRFVSKLHHGRSSPAGNSRHSAAAAEFLHHCSSSSSPDNLNNNLDNLLVSFQGKLSGADDFTFLLRELGNRGDHSAALRCFDFALSRERRRNQQGKLASSMISVLGRLGKIELARNVFNTAVSQGYGNTVYAYSALISAYAKSGLFDEAIKVFDAMKVSGLVPNLVTYNALIDACGKGGGDYKTALDIFNEMWRNGVQPDRITYNSLLAVCSAAGLWEKAEALFEEMGRRGVERDIYTYNTLLDAACNGGKVDEGIEIMYEMGKKNVCPNEVTYSTLIRGCAKAGRLEKAISLFNEMKNTGVRLDRVSYNTQIAIYAGLGKFEQALDVGHDMESRGFKWDVITYNALLDGFGKQGMYNEVKAFFREMKTAHLSPNLLTYSTLLSVYSKGGLYREAMEVYKEFKREGLKADVVFYSNLIDSLCKNGLVESSALLLEEMTEKGIQPNVVTYNSIINAFGQSMMGERMITDGESCADTSQSVVVRDATGKRFEYVENDRIIKIFKQLDTQSSGLQKENNKGTEEVFCILGVFQKMHELKIKPNVVTFSAILNACSRCSSFEEASLLLEELRLFDNQVYGVAHGLLMGYGDNVWKEAIPLFDQVKQMDSSTASAFYNALTDVLWHFGQRKGAQKVVLEGHRRQAWENVWSDSSLDLHLMSSGAARAMVHEWLLKIRTIVFNGHKLPELLSILTGWGKHSKVVGDGTLKRVIEALLTRMGSPFEVAGNNIGRFRATGALVSAWLKQKATYETLLLHDDRTQTAFSLS